MVFLAQMEGGPNRYDMREPIIIRRVLAHFFSTCEALIFWKIIYMLDCLSALNWTFEPFEVYSFKESSKSKARNYENQISQGSSPNSYASDLITKDHKNGRKIPCPLNGVGEAVESPRSGDSIPVGCRAVIRDYDDKCGIRICRNGIESAGPQSTPPHRDLVGQGTANWHESMIIQVHRPKI